MQVVKLVNVICALCIFSTCKKIWAGWWLYAKMNIYENLRRICQQLYSSLLRRGLHQNRKGVCSIPSGGWNSCVKIIYNFQFEQIKQQTVSLKRYITNLVSLKPYHKQSRCWCEGNPGFRTHIEVKFQEDFSIFTSRWYDRLINKKFECHTAPKIHVAVM